MRLRNGIIPPKVWEILRRQWAEIPEVKFIKIVEYVFDKQIAGKYPPTSDLLIDLSNKLIPRAISDMLAEKRRREERERKFPKPELEEGEPPPEGFWDEVKKIGRGNNEPL